MQIGGEELWKGKGGCKEGWEAEAEGFVGWLGANKALHMCLEPASTRLKVRIGFPDLQIMIALRYVARGILQN